MPVLYGVSATSINSLFTSALQGERGDVVHSDPHSYRMFTRKCKNKSRAHSMDLGNADLVTKA